MSNFTGCFDLTQVKTNYPFKYSNGCRKCVDIMTGEKLSSIKVAFPPLIYWSVHFFSRKEKDRVKSGNGRDHILAHYKFHIIRVHDILV